MIDVLHSSGRFPKVSFCFYSWFWNRNEKLALLFGLCSAIPSPFLLLPHQISVLGSSVQAHLSLCISLLQFILWSSVVKSFPVLLSSLILILKIDVMLVNLGKDPYCAATWFIVIVQCLCSFAFTGSCVNRM